MRHRPFHARPFGVALLEKEIVTRHEGTIAVTSVEGEGSTFTVVLPRAGVGQSDVGDGTRSDGNRSASLHA